MPVKNSSAIQNDVIKKNIFDILGLSSIPKNQKDEMLQKMLQIVYQRVVARIMDVLSENASRNLKLAIDSGDEKTANALLIKHGLLSFTEMMAEEALFLKYEMDALLKGDSTLTQ